MCNNCKIILVQIQNSNSHCVKSFEADFMYAGGSVVWFEICCLWPCTQLPEARHQTKLNSQVCVSVCVCVCVCVWERVCLYCGSRNWAKLEFFVFFWSFYIITSYQAFFVVVNVTSCIKEPFTIQSYLRPWATTWIGNGTAHSQVENNPQPNQTGPGTYYVELLKLEGILLPSLVPAKPLGEL